ncbi:ankyrin-3 [Rhypophila decipiens]
MATVSLYEEAFQKFRKHASERYQDSKEQEVLAAFLRERASAEDTIEAAETLRSDSQRKYGSKKVGDIEIPQQWVDKIMGNIGTFVEAGNIAMKGAPESVGMAWFAVKLTLTAIQNNYELYSFFGSGLGDITEIMIVVRHYDRLYDERANAKWKPSPLVEKLFGDVISAYEAVLDFSFAVRRHLTAGTLTRFKHGFKDFFGSSKNKFEGKLNTIAELKKKIVEGSQGAFQDKTLTQLEGMSGVLQSITGTVNDIKEFQAQQEQWHKESTARLDSILQAVEDIKSTTKRKTPWDYAVEAFNTNRKALKPLHVTTETLANAIDSIHPGTAEWVFDDWGYQDWTQSKASKVLIVTGREGTGKSTVLASIVNRLSSEEKPDEELLYISCDMSATSGSSDHYDAKSICNTFLFQLYGMALEAGEDVRLLEACNDLFKNPKSKEAQRIGKTRVNKEDDLPDFAETFVKISQLLKKNMVLVLDGISTALSGDEQKELVREFTGLVENDITTGTPDWSIKILLGCTDKPDLRGYVIDVEEHVMDDMAKILRDSLKVTPSLSAAEQEEAEAVILPKAASQFRYLCQVAIPFIREPFVRPLSKRLEALPGGLTDKYDLALRKMKPNYVGLLRTALTWSLLAPEQWPGWPLGREVMDAFYGTYDTPLDTTGQEQEVDDKFPAITRLELDQLREAAGPFLTTDMYANLEGDFYVFPRERQQVEEFCFRHQDNDLHASEHGDTDGVCSRCKSELEQKASVSMDRKEGHLLMAITCLRHLNHPTFQKRTGLVSGTEPVKSQVDNEEPASSSAEEEKPVAPKAGEEPVADSKDDQESGEEGEKETEGDHGEGEEDNEDGITVSTVDTDESREVEVIIEERHRAEETSPDTEDSTRIRYELQYWAHHIRQAEDLWTPEERQDNPAWQELYAEFDKFTSNPDIVLRWQTLHPEYVDTLEEASKPLNIAAAWGLVSVAEHLIKHGADPNVLSRSRTALQSAARAGVSLEMAKLLFASGSDPNIRGEDSDPPLYEWMRTDSSMEAVKTFLDAGADPSLPDTDNCNAMHWVALFGNDPALVDVLTDAGADINARDTNDATPLHYLLLRREVPNDMLAAFIRKGADRNAEDKGSSRPLQMAAVWGDIDALRTILAPGVEEIDDPDSSGDTALYQATYGGHAETVRLLLESGANPKIQNKLGRAALHEAIFGNKKETVEVLLDWEKDHPDTVGINLLANHDRTPFFFACLSQDDEVTNIMLDALVRNNLPLSQINQLTKRGRTPFRQACEGRDDIVSRLIQLATEQDDFASLLVNQQYANNGMTALHRAAKGGHFNCVRLLLDPKLGTDITLKDKEGHTALQHAYQEWALDSDKADYEDIISLLIDMDPSAACNDAELIGTAAANGSTRLLKQLWRLKADLNMRDQYGWTPLEIARKSQQKSAEEFLSKQQTWTSMLPTRWATAYPFASAGSAGSLVAEEDGSTTGTRLGHFSGQKVCLASNRPLPAGLDEYYFEVTFHDIPHQDEPPQEHPIVAIGFCTIGGAALEFPGWPSKPNASKAKSWAMHGDDGGLFCSFIDDWALRQYLGDYKYGLPGDVVGCGVNLRTGEMFWTKNGTKIPAAVFKNVDGRLFPVIGLDHKVWCTTNFGGEPFMWKGEGTDLDLEDGEAELQAEGEEAGTATVVEVVGAVEASDEVGAGKVGVVAVSATAVAVEI